MILITLTSLPEFSYLESSATSFFPGARFDERGGELTGVNGRYILNDKSE